MPAKRKPHVTTRAYISTTAPVSIYLRHDGNRWVVEEIMVHDEEVVLDLRRIKVHDRDTCGEIPLASDLAQSIFNAAQSSDWPAWDIGC
jgi:hypothetical protein